MATTTVSHGGAGALAWREAQQKGRSVNAGVKPSALNPEPRPAGQSARGLGLMRRQRIPSSEQMPSMMLVT